MRIFLWTLVLAFADDGKPIYHCLWMVRFARIIVALVCIACVLALCVAPYVDIPETVLKSIQIVLLLVLSLAAFELSLLSLLNVMFVLQANVRPDRASHMHILLPPFEKSCVLQC